MSLYKSGTELKDLAKGKLERNYGISIFTLITVGLLESSASMFLSQLIPTETFAAFLFYYIINFILTAFLGIFQTGICLFYLNMACGQPYKLEDLFYGFQTNPKQSFTVSFVTGLVSWICSLPYLILLRLAVETGSSAYFLWVPIAYAIGFLVKYPITLALSQSFYLLLDFPDYSGRQALVTSCKIMKKHMGRLFLIQLRFLPLMILCVLTFFIGFLWLIPFMNMTYTLFFLDIMKAPTD